MSKSRHCGFRALATLHAKEHDGGDGQQRDAAACRADAQWGSAAATPATAPRGSVDGALPLCIPFRAEKQGKSPKVGICNYVELIDTIFTDVEGVD